MIRIAPSFLSADFGNLELEIRRVEAGRADMIHLDVMDGHFVPNLTFGPLVVKAIRQRTSLPLDVHLMIADPARYADAFIKAGADILTLHLEIGGDIPGLLERVRLQGAIPGVSIKPATPVSDLFPLLPSIGHALVMSVEPGFGGQSFMPSSIEKIRTLRREVDRTGAQTKIEVDGGIGTPNIRDVARAGADIVVAGSSVFKRGSVEANIRALRQAVTAPFQAPCLVGSSVDSAFGLLYSLGLRPGRIEHREQPGTRADTVVEQDPQAGAEVRAGDKIDLVVSR